MSKAPTLDQDPKDAHDKPPYKEKEQQHPGVEEQMRVKPDFGEDSYKGYNRLADRVAVITGGDSGIGRAVALAFAREGADVVIGYLNEHEDAEETKRVVTAAGRKAVTVAGDLADEAQCKRLIDEAVKAFGRIDILVNNAAHQGKSVEKFEEISPDRVERTFRVNIIELSHPKT